MSRRTWVLTLAGLGIAGLVLGLWVLDWWSLERPAGTLRADLRRIEACDGARCVAGVTGGVIATAVLAGGTLLAILTAVLAALHLTGAQLAPRLVRVQIGLATLVLGATVVVIGAMPDGVGGAGTTWGAWATVVGVVASVALGFGLARGEDPLGEGRRFQPIKVDVPRAPPATSTPPPIKEVVHVDAPAARRRSTRPIYTSPPGFDAGRQALRFVVAEATISDSGLAGTLEDHHPFDLPWSVFVRAAARQLPPGPPFDRTIVVDLITAGGSPLRFLASTRVNYAALPGGAAPASRENLRKLIAHAMNRHAGCVVEPDSAEFFSGAREPPVCASLKQFVTYDEQFTGAIGPA